MRLTFTLDDDLFRLVKAYAEGRSLTMGKAVSELVRRGLNEHVRTRVVNGLVVFDVPPSSKAAGGRRPVSRFGARIGKELS